MKIIDWVELSLSIISTAIGIYLIPSDVNSAIVSSLITYGIFVIVLKINKFTMSKREH